MFHKETLDNYRQFCIKDMKSKSGKLQLILVKVLKK